MIASFIFISCSHPQSNLPYGYRVTPIPSPEDDQFCSIAETHLSNLCKANPQDNMYCCQAVSSTKKGDSFTVFCLSTLHAGIALNPLCISKIIKCEELDLCLRTRI